MFLCASRRFNFTVLLCLGQMSVACSSLDEDTPDHVDLALPHTVWTVSSSDSQWRASPPSGTIPRFVCGGPQAIATDCCAPPWDCQRYPLACDPTANRCALTFDVEAWETVDLGDEVDAVAEVQGRVLSRVEVLELDASVERTEEFPVRSLALFIGPVAMTDSSAATLLAPIGMEPGPQPLSPGISARNALSGLARDYATPFTLLLKAHAVVPDGFSSEGMLRASLDGKLRAYY